jgi:hypothetical protein
MTQQTINTGTTANDGTGDTLRIAGNKINSNFTELYNILGGGTTYLSLSNSGLIFNDVYDVTLAAVTPTAARIINLPDASGTVVLAGNTATLSNKTLASPIINSPTITSMVLHAGAQNYTFVASNISQDTNINLPLLTDSDTFIFADHTATLTNKSFVNPVISTTIKDANTNEIIKLSPTLSAVREITIANANGSGSPSITASGEDADSNINLSIQPRGTGVVTLGKVAFATKTLSPGDSDTEQDTVIFTNFSTAQDIHLKDGTVTGEYKVVINRGTGILTILPTVDNFDEMPGGATSVVLEQYDTAQFIWSAAGGSWLMIGGVDSANSILI